MSETLHKLGRVLEERKSADPSTSYVAKLYHEGLDSILKKIGEEATETILAAKSDDAGALIHETADLWFHTLVLLASKDIEPRAILDELERRFTTSGLAEKAARAETG